MKKHVFIFDVIIGFYENVVLPFTLSKVNHIICSSEVTQRVFLHHYKPVSSVITPGVDTKMFTRRTHVPDDKRVIFVGNFEQTWKGLEYLKAAVARLAGVKLIVVGNGQQVAAPGVEYRGILDGKKLVHEIQQASVAVLPSTSTSESFGMVLVEAMACGVPVIGSKVGGIPAVIDDGITGLLVPPADVEALTAALQKLLSDKKYAAKIAANGYAKASSTFTWESSVEKLVACIKQVSDG